MRHPDERTSAFDPAQGWCKTCGLVMRVHGGQVSWWGEDGFGPFCSTKCMRTLDAQGALPDTTRVLLNPNSSIGRVTALQFEHGDKPKAHPW